MKLMLQITSLQGAFYVKLGPKISPHARQDFKELGLLCGKAKDPCHRSLA